MSILNPKKIQIRRSMEYRYSAKEWRIGEPKSKSGYRTIPLTEEAVAILKKQKEKNKRISEISTEWEEFVFLRRKGTSAKNSTYDTSDVTEPFKYWKHLWQCNGPLNGPLAKISMLKFLEIKGFTGGNIKNEIRYRRFTQCREKYII